MVMVVRIGQILDNWLVPTKCEGLRESESNGESAHPCLVPDFRGNAFNFSRMDLREAEDIKKGWQEYTEELYKKWSSRPR